jgi:4-hydroxythreonine-4-phosphate dehydrogenase
LSLTKPQQRLPIAVSIGEVSGIGPDVILMSWIKRLEKNIAPFYVVGSLSLLLSRAARLGLDVPLQAISHSAQATEIFHEKLPVWDLGEADDHPSQPANETADLVISSIKTAVYHISQGWARGIATAPISKYVLQKQGFSYPGHTEYLGALADLYWPQGEPHKPLMMLAFGVFRTVPLTVHTALRTVCGRVDLPIVDGAIRSMDGAIRPLLGGRRPRIAVAGLNPHAGENGTMGDEEVRVLIPAIRQLQSEGYLVSGPHPADTMFHAEARAHYDVALCMYHDQALIPIKTLGFHDAINVTLGLPFWRSSPDHGTAFDLAGTGKARPDSMIAALKFFDEVGAEHD